MWGETSFVVLHTSNSDQYNTKIPPEHVFFTSANLSAIKRLLSDFYTSQRSKT